MSDLLFFTSATLTLVFLTPMSLMTSGYIYARWRCGELVDVSPETVFASVVSVGLWITMFVLIVVRIVNCINY